MGGYGISDMEYTTCFKKAPKLIDFFKSEGPLGAHRDMVTHEYVCGPRRQLQGSVNPAAPSERAVADESVEPTLVDFFKGGNGDLHLHHHGVNAPVISRSSAEARQPPMPKLEFATGDHWSLHTANPPEALRIIFSPASTGTEESGTAAPKTPNCDLEMACSRTYPDQILSSVHRGSAFSQNSSDLPTPEVCADSGIISHSRKRSPPEETEAVVQAATSLLSLASSEGTRRRCHPDVSSGDPAESERESDEEAGLSSSSSVLSRPANKRRYKWVVDLLA